MVCPSRTTEQAHRVCGSCTHTYALLFSLRALIPPPPRVNRPCRMHCPPLSHVLCHTVHTLLLLHMYTYAQHFRRCIFLSCEAFRWHSLHNGVLSQGHWSYELSLSLSLSLFQHTHTHTSTRAQFLLASPLPNKGTPSPPGTLITCCPSKCGRPCSVGEEGRDGQQGHRHRHRLCRVLL